MQISIIQAILIGTLYYLTNNGVPWLTGLGQCFHTPADLCGNDCRIDPWKAGGRLYHWGLRSIPCIWAL